jgi:hypothetical protein
MGTPHRSNTTANGICRPTNGQVKSTRCACPSYKETSPATEMFTLWRRQKPKDEISSVGGPLRQQQEGQLRVAMEISELSTSWQILAQTCRVKSLEVTTRSDSCPTRNFG